jgi:hypothetical protein
VKWGSPRRTSPAASRRGFSAAQCCCKCCSITPGWAHNVGSGSLLQERQLVIRHKSKPLRIVFRVNE